MRFSAHTVQLAKSINLEKLPIRNDSVTIKLVAQQEVDESGERTVYSERGISRLPVTPSRNKSNICTCGSCLSAPNTLFLPFITAFLGTMASGSRETNCTRRRKQRRRWKKGKKDQRPRHWRFFPLSLFSSPGL